MPFKDPAKRREYHRRYNRKPARVAYRAKWYEENAGEVKASVYRQRQQAHEEQLEMAMRLLGGLDQQDGER